MKRHKPDTSLPPPVAAHVQRQLIRHDWERLLSELRTLCADCPADRDGEDSPCTSCPFCGLATLAATITVSSKLIRMKDKHNI